MIAKAKADVAEVKPVPVEVEIDGDLVSVEFAPVGGMEWAELTATHPPRKGSEVDRRYGYNVHGVIPAYPVDKITSDGEPISADLWGETVPRLSGPDVEIVATIVYGVNMVDPAKKKSALGKARASQNT